MLATHFLVAVGFAIYALDVDLFGPAFVAGIMVLLVLFVPCCLGATAAWFFCAHVWSTLMGQPVWAVIYGINAALFALCFSAAALGLFGVPPGLLVWVAAPALLTAPLFARVLFQPR